MTATKDTLTDTGAITGGERVHVGDPLYSEIAEFLIDEAVLLDEDRLDDWVALLAEDLVYRAPVRVTRERGKGSEFSERLGHFDDDRASIAGRVHRLVRTSSGWSEDPPSRTRRLLSTIVIHRSDTSDEFAVNSSLLLVRNRLDSPRHELISAARHDVLRRTSSGWQIARRTIFLDQEVLGSANLAIFL